MAVENEIQFEDSSVAVFSRSVPVFALDNKYSPAKRPSSVKLKNYLKTKFFTQWGEDDNLWPDTIADALKGCAPAQICIETAAAITYGNGVKVMEAGNDGKATPVFDEKQQTWMRNARLHHYLQAAATDYWQLGNQYAQLIANRAKTGFAMLSNTSAPWVRLGLYEEKEGRVTKAYIHGNWDKLPDKKECTEANLLDTLDPESQLWKNEKLAVDSIMMRTGNYTPGNLFYDDHPWHALVRTGELDIFPEIATIKKNRIKNALFVKYHVRINTLYWWTISGKNIEDGKSKWEGMTTAQRKAKRTAFYQEIDSKLTGSDNSFKSLFSETGMNSRGEMVQLITLEKVEMESGENAIFDPDKMSSVANILFAFGIPSALLNTPLNDTKSRGGGSDIREALTAYIAKLRMHQNNLLEPIDLAMRNTYPDGRSNTPLLKPNQFLQIENTLLTTLDSNSSGAQKTIS